MGRMETTCDDWQWGEMGALIRRSCGKKKVTISGYLKMGRWSINYRKMKGYV